MGRLGRDHLSLCHYYRLCPQDIRQAWDQTRMDCRRLQVLEWCLLVPFQLTENRYVLYLLCEHSGLAFRPKASRRGIF